MPEDPNAAYMPNLIQSVTLVPNVMNRKTIEEEYSIVDLPGYAIKRPYI